MTDLRLSLFGPHTAVDDLLDQTAGPAHKTDPHTSRAAARANAVRSGTQRHRVLAALAAAGDHGATDYELSVACAIVRPHIAGNRRKELRDRFDPPLVATTGRTRPTDTGNAALVHVVTAAGRAVLAEVEEADRG